MKIEENYSLEKYNTFGLKGAAKYYAEVKTKEEFLDLVDWAENNSQKVYVLGGGSNAIVPDQGVDGLVIRFINNEMKYMHPRIEVGAGAPLATINALAVKNSLSGLEWCAGIPRVTLGGAIRGNAGAFMQSIEEIVETIEVYDKLNKKFELLSRRMCKFEYRNSIIKSSERYILFSAVLKMKEDEQTHIQERVEKSLSFRFDKYPRLPSAGSVFENLDLDQVEAANKELFDKVLKDKIGREGHISAGLLIDMAGAKGKRIGGMKVSLEHANHIVNTGNGTSEDFVMLVSFIKQQVRDRFKIQLKEEVSYFGL